MNKDKQKIQEKDLNVQCFGQRGKIVAIVIGPRPPVIRPVAPTIPMNSTHQDWDPLANTQGYDVPHVGNRGSIQHVYRHGQCMGQKYLFWTTSGTRGIAIANHKLNNIEEVLGNIYLKVFG